MMTLLTVTGDRRNAFALCERWMRRQTRPIDQWIVVDDGSEPTRCTMGQTVIRLDAPHNPNGHSFCAKFRAAINSGAIIGDSLAFIEDDDWYAADYLETLANKLGDLDIAGESPALYYHVGQRGSWQHENMAHASLCQTAISRRLFPQLGHIAATGTRFIDLPLWQGSPVKRNLFRPVNGKRSCIGIKGMPGRAGLGAGHYAVEVYRPDHDLSFLRSLIGDDADVYAPFANLG